jgi:hypothetical protein
MRLCRANILLPLLVGVALISAPSRAFAQGTATQISDRELTAFAKAYTEVQQIRSQYEPSLRKTKDAKESEKLKKTLNKEGLSVDRYNKIYAAVNANEELRRKALRIVEQERKKS